MKYIKIIATFIQGLTSDSSQNGKPRHAVLIDDAYIMSLFDAADRRLADHKKGV